MSDDDAVLIGSSLEAKLFDVQSEDLSLKGPLDGFFPPGLPVPTLEKALSSIAEIVTLFAWDTKNVKKALRQAKNVQKRYKHMTIDEISSIILYTMESLPRDASLYFRMNKALRAKDRNTIKPWRDYIWLLMNSLKKVPPSKIRSVNRGCKGTLQTLNMNDLSAGDDFSWSAFSSVTTTVEVMKTFLGSDGDRVLLQIELTESVARDIQHFSLFPAENELLLPPNMSFQFQSKFPAGHGLVIVQLKQIESLDSILDLSEKDEVVATEIIAKAPAAVKLAAKPEEDALEVRQFLRDAGLLTFASKVIKSGFDTLAILAKATKEELQAMGFKAGHIHKFEQKRAEKFAEKWSAESKESESSITEVVKSVELEAHQAGKGKEETKVDAGVPKETEKATCVKNDCLDVPWSAQADTKAALIAKAETKAVETVVIEALAAVDNKTTAEEDTVKEVAALQGSEKIAADGKIEPDHETPQKEPAKKMKKTEKNTCAPNEETSQDDGAPAKKKPKVCLPEMPKDKNAMRELLASGGIDKLPTPMLKEWLRSLSWTTSGKREQLLDRVRASVGL